MVVNFSQQMNVEIIPEILNMPVYFDEQAGYVPLAFFTELGVLEEDIKNILGIDRLDEFSITKMQIDEPENTLVLHYQG